LSNEFIFFVETNQEAILRYKKEPDYLLTAVLNSAIVNNNIEEAMIVLKAGAELNAVHKHFEFERPPIILASLYGHLEVVKELIARGANPNIVDKNGMTALHEAARMGRLQIVKALIQSGALTEVRNQRQERPIDLTNHFITKGNFEKYFAPWHVNLALDHQRYQRETPVVRRILQSSVVDSEQDSASEE
jgi:ankyrin repeat protein